MTFLMSPSILTVAQVRHVFVKECSVSTSDKERKPNGSQWELQVENSKEIQSLLAEFFSVVF